MERGGQYYRSDKPITVTDAVYGNKVLQEGDLEKGLVLTAECTDPEHPAGSGVAFKTGLTVGDLDKIAVLADFNTHGTGVFNLFFDLNKNGKYFEWEDNRYLGTGEDNYALCQSKTVHESESFVIDGATEFHLMKNGGVHSLADIASGNAGIPVDTPVAFWVGVWDSTADDGDVSLTLRDVRVNPSRLLVDDDFRDYKFGDVISCDGYSYVYGFDAFNSIQEAIDAAPEDATVRVKEGTYEEVIKINKSMWLQGEGADSTIIKPSIELNAIVTVSGQGVSAKITGFTVQGPCTVKGPESFLAGILIRDGAYCEIRENIIKDIKEVPNLAGMQRGIGVFVGKESWGTTGTATIEDNVICGYQKGGIVVDNVGSEADIIGNQITGWGETPVIAQNGIQVSRGATAIVQENTVSGHWYTGDNWSSAGILLYEAGDTTVTGNTLNKNQVAIYTNSRASFPAVLNNSFGTADLSNGLDVNVKTDGWPAPDEVWVDPAYAGLEDGTIVGQAIVGYNACPSISEGIAEVAYNGTVYVAAGTYAENLNINKPISLNGAQAGVDARDRDSSEESVITGDTEWLRIRADGVTIDGFTIDSAGWDGHIAPEANNITIKNNIIKRQIYVATGISNLTVTQNWFKDIGTGEQKASAFTSEKGIANLRIESNNFTNIGYSAVIFGGSEKYENTVIKDNYIYGCGYQAFNLAGDQHGLLVTGNYIKNACSKVDWDTQPDRGGIRIYGSAFTGPVNITNNTVVDSYNGFAVRNGENIKGKEINVTHNKFLGNQNAGVYHGGTGTLNAILNYWGAPTGPTVKGEGADHVKCVPWYADEALSDMVVGENIVVNSTKGKSYASIQAAINEAGDGDTILVGAGEYEENLIINGKKIVLLSTDGAEATIIEPAEKDRDTIYITGNTDGVQIGSEGYGFTIIGADGPPGIERAAIYLQGPHSNTHIEGNVIEANGDSAILTEWGAAVSGLVITGNEISGKTFAGDHPAGQGTQEQYTLPNVPRALVYIGGTNKANITFTHNRVTGVAGGLNEKDKPQGNAVVNIDSAGALIAHNSFSGHTAWTGASLRARGTDTVIRDNAFSSGPLLNVHVFLGDGTVEGGADDVVASNTFDRSAHVVDGTQVFSNIQSAVDAASSGDTVKVAAGTYLENVVIRGGKDELRLTGAGSEKTTIAPVSGRAVALQGYPEGRPISRIEIEGFTLKPVDGAPLIALSSTPDNNPYTKDLVLRDIVIAQGQLGIILNAVDGVTLEDVHLSNVAGEAGALELSGVSGFTATGCTFENNKVAIRLQPTGEGDIGQGYGPNGVIVITQSTFQGNEIDIDNQDDKVMIDASLNWWGDKRGPDGDKLLGEVKSVPWYVDANMTTQSNQLALTCQIDGNGSVTLRLGDNEYKHDEDVLWNYGDEVQLVATPGSGWRFSRWEGDISGAPATSREIAIVMDGNKAVTAVFTRIPTDPGPGTGGPSGPVEPPVIAPSVTETVEAEVGGTVELEDGSAAVELPANAVPEDVTVTLAPVTEVTQPTTGMVMIAGKVFEITAETEDGELVTQFSEPITLTFKLTQEELEEAGVDLDDLKVFYWDEKAGAWIALPTRVDPETGTVTAVTDHFTVFAVMAKPDMPALSDIEGHWGEKDILRLVSLGVVGGYEDGTFRPEAGITRQEFAKMVVLAAGLEPDAEPELTFADTDEIAEWARGYVSAAVRAGIITGVGDNRFAPTDPVTRAQAATMIMRSLGEVGTSLELTFADAESIPEWAKAAILGAVEKGIVNGFEDNTFKPDLSATRVQAAKMLSKLTVVRFED